MGVESMLMGLGTAWLALLVGCGTETGNPENNVELLYNARTTLPDRVSLEGADQTTRVDAVWLRLGPVEIDGACEGDGIDRFDALGLADHSGDKPARQQKRQEALSLCELSMSLEPGAAEPGAPEQTKEASVVLTGALSDDRAFTIVLDELIDVALDLGGQPAPDGALLLSFDVATWIEPSELLQLVDDPIVVSADQHPEVASAVTRRIAQGVQLHVDRNANGFIDADDTRLDE